MLRKLFNWFKRIVVFFLVLGFLGGISLYLYIENSIDKYLDKASQTSIIQKVKSTPQLPPSFHKVYQKYFNEDANNSLWPSLIESLVYQKSNECPCRHVAFDFSRHLRKNRIGFFVLQAYLEDEIGNRKCFEYYLNNAQYRNQRSYEYLLENHYHKDVKELTEHEILELLVIPQANTYFNPITHPDNLSRQVKWLKERVSK